MCKHVVMIIANSPNPAYFRWFAELNAKEKALKLTFIFLLTEKPLMIEDVKELGVTSHWFYFNYAKSKYYQYIKLFFQLLYLFYKIKPDVVQTNLFDDSLPSLFAARVARIKKRIITKQDTGFHIRYAPKGIFFDKLNNINATDIIPVSNETLELVLKYENAKNSKLKLIHHGINENYFELSTPQNIKFLKNKYNLQNKIVIGIVARYVQSKGYREIIAAASKLVKKHANLVFIGVGWGDQKDELDRLIGENLLEEKFILTGKIDFNLMPSVYQCFNIYLQASVYEPFGFVIAEAMFCRVPIVSTSVGACRDVLVHKESAYIIEFNSPGDIEKGIEYMLENNREEIASNAHILAEKYFAKKIMWTNYKEIFLS